MWGGVVIVLSCIPLKISYVDHLFMCLFPFVYLFWRNVYLSLLSICDWVGFLLLSFRSSVFSDNLSLIRYMICKYLLPFCGLHFHSVDSNFWYTQFQSFHDVRLFSFVTYTFGVVSRKSLSNPMSSKSSTALGLTLRSLIHFELISVYGIRPGSILILWYVVPSFPSTICCKDCPFPSESPWFPCQIFDHVCVDLFPSCFIKLVYPRVFGKMALKFIFL